MGHTHASNSYLMGQVLLSPHLTDEETKAETLSDLAKSQKQREVQLGHKPVLTPVPALPVPTR